MKTFFDTNILLVEDIIRLLVGATLIGLVMYGVQVVPVWLALVAVYPIVTAIIAWDPIYAAFRLLKTVTGTPQGFGGRLAIK